MSIATKPKCKRGRPVGPAAAPTTRLGQHLVALRGQRSVLQIATLVGVGHSKWRRWESGEALPDLVEVARIVTALGAKPRPLVEAGLADALE